MQANGITAYDYHVNGAELVIVLSCTVDQALAMDTSKITIKTDQGSIVETFANYVKKSATLDVATNCVTLLCQLDADGSGSAVAALAQELAAAKTHNAALQLQLQEQAIAIRELTALVKGTAS